MESVLLTVDAVADLQATGHGEIFVQELFAALQHPSNLLLLDVRNDEEFRLWRIEGRYTPETLHLPYFFFLEDEDNAVAQVKERIQDRRPVVVVCAKGGASGYVAERLRAHGVRAINLAGGMVEWGDFYDVRAVAQQPDYRIYQVDRVARGCVSWVFISRGEAAVVDPLRFGERYLKLLKQQGAQLKLLLDTHAHADHISSGPELAQMTGAAYHLHPYDAIHPFDMLPARMQYEMLHDGQRFTLGALQIEVIHTPGHTLGQVNFLVTTPDGEAFCCTGDNLFIESFGRPDLGGQGERWAPVVYDTIFGVMKRRVPARAWILPGHYASPAEANPDGLYMKRLEDLWRENRSLHFTDKERFVEFVLSHLPYMPPQYMEIKRVNIGLSNPSLDEADELELGKNICALSG
ncbi:MAG: MBL fold metallo-hydrolase [Caldilinea sp.]|nr:MBL fold metallo-hydrolase [Caldilinea sp.]MDW8440250.1 MBL fold metallo-hydrolase [Caldilineaceae bacterium]